jgi:uroporphyrinogen decarboxylase
VVNCSLKLVERRLRPAEAAELFGRPFMGGLDRLGALARGTADEIRQAVAEALAEAPRRFILAADCTVPGDTPWDNLKLAIDLAHQAR